MKSIKEYFSFKHLQRFWGAVLLTAACSSCGVIIENVETAPTGAIVITQTSTLSFADDSSGSFDVALSTAPPGELIVNINTDGAVTASPSQLVFNVDNWSQDQSVTLTANGAVTVASGEIYVGQVTLAVSANSFDVGGILYEGLTKRLDYWLTESAAEWIHEAYLKAPNTSSSDAFGFSTAIDGDTVAVGAFHESSNTTSIIHGSDLSSTNNSGVSNGAVYIFKRTGNTWAHEAYLKSPRTSNSDWFGYSVAIDDDTVALGALSEDSNTTSIIHGSDLSSANDSGNNNGAVYIFKRTGSTWSHEAYLKSPRTSNIDIFGSSVAIDGNTVAVGAYTEDSNTTSIINGSDLSSANDSGSENGAVYVFKRTGSTWAHEAYLKAPRTSNGDNFGSRVAIDSDTVAIGATGEDSNTTSIIHGSDLSSANDSGANNGAVYIFKRTVSTWAHEAYLKSPRTTSSDQFGYSVAIDSDTVAVGAYFEDSSTTSIVHGSDLSSANDSGNDNGAVYIFKRTGSTWAHEAYLKAPNTSNSDYFGFSVAIDGDTVAVGANQEDSNTTSIVHGSDLSSANDSGANNGAVYIFKRTGNTWAHEAYLKAPNTGNDDHFGYSVSIDADTVAVGAYGEDSNTTSIINGSDLSSANDSGNVNGAVYIFRRHRQ